MSWSDRTGDPLPPGHPERRGRQAGGAGSTVRSWLLVAVTTITGKRSRR